MGMARIEEEEHDEHWRNMMLKLGHKPDCNVFEVMGKCDCGRKERENA